MRCLLSGAHNSRMSAKVWNKETTPGPGLDAIRDLHLSSRTLCTAPDKALYFSLIMTLCWSLYVFGRGETMQPDVSERQCLLWNDKRADCQMLCFRKKMRKKVNFAQFDTKSRQWRRYIRVWEKQIWSLVMNEISQCRQGSSTEERSRHRVGAADSSQSLNHRSKGTPGASPCRRAGAKPDLRLIIVLMCNWARQAAVQRSTITAWPSVEVSY